MYTAHFGFREKPFNATPDPRFFYSNRVYQEAYATLLYGILERKGFVVLMGEVGTGKTTLLRRLMDNLDPSVKVVFFYNTTLSFDEIVAFMCTELDLPVKGLSRLEKLQALNDFLLAEARRGGTVVLLIDEAQNLSAEVLENLRLISNLETATEKLLQIVLVGQPELKAKLQNPALRQVAQRIAIRYRLERLSDEEVGAFIMHRLRVAGRDGNDLFTPEAIRRVVAYADGIPRLINILCDGALLIAYGSDARKVEGPMVDEVAADLGLRPRETAARPARPVEPAPPPPPRPARPEPGPVPAPAASARRRLRTRRRGPGLVAAALALLLAVAAGIVLAPRLRVGDALGRLAQVRDWLSLPFAGAREPRRAPVEPPRPPAGERRPSGEDTPQPEPVPARTPPAPGASAPVPITATRPPLAPPAAEAPRRAPTAEPAHPEPGGSSGAPTPETARPAAAESARFSRGERTARPAPPAQAAEPGPSRKPLPITKKAGIDHVVVPPGSTVSEIAFAYYGDYSPLALDLIKELNPHIDDLDRVLAGGSLALPSITLDMRIREQPDGSFRLILASLPTLAAATRLAQLVRAQGHEAVISARQVSRNQFLHRVEIDGLATREAAARLWGVAVAQRWTELPQENGR